MNFILTLDFVAAASAITSTIMSGLRIRYTWIFSLLSSFVYAVIFGVKGLNFNLLVHLAYIPISLYGAFNWGLKKQNDKHIRSLKPLIFKTLIVSTLLCSMLITHYSESFLDIMTSMLSSTALILLSNHFIECWILWLICDALYLLMYLQSDLFYSLYKSAFYIAFAGYSYYRWHRKLQLNKDSS